MSYSQMTIVGRLGRDPEHRMTSTGKQIVSASVAVGSGEKTQWFKVNAWEKTGEWLKDAKKGDFVFAQGSLELRTYEKKTGGTAIDAIVNAQIVRTSHKKEAATDETYGGVATRMAPNADFDLEDLPF